MNKNAWEAGKKISFFGNQAHVVFMSLDFAVFLSSSSSIISAYSSKVSLFGYFLENASFPATKLSAKPMKTSLEFNTQTRI